MARKSNQARAGIAATGEKISELAWRVGRDQRKEARLQRRWWLLQTALGVALTLFARRIAERVWIVATGEEPPVLGHAGEPAKELARSERPPDQDRAASAGEDRAASAAATAPAPASAASSAPDVTPAEAPRVGLTAAGESRSEPATRGEP